MLKMTLVHTIMHKSSKDTCQVPFHSVINSALAAGVASFSGSPSSGISSRAGTEADAWCHYRILKLRFRVLPSAATPVQTSAGWVGGIQDTPPTTLAQIGELLPSTILGAGQTAPSEWITVPPNDLKGPLPWYKTIPGTADATEESPGALVIAGTGTNIYLLEVRGVYEFKTSVNTGNTPAELALRDKIRKERVQLHQDRERERLLRALSSPASNVKTQP
jgi:hypothetical protein